MGKKRASTRQGDGIEATRVEKRQKKRQDRDSSQMVNSDISGLFKNEDRIKMYNEKFKEREILEYKHVDFENLTKMYETQEIDVANYLATHMWSDFVQVHRPINKTLVRILISNLDLSTMVSWIGKIKVDLSETAWNNIFEMIHVREEEEEALMQMSKEDVFYRLTGETNLGMSPFIRINQLHQEANVRLSAQILMNVLIPKKGSKEQVKVEEGRLLYAMIYGKPISLARMIVERLKSACERKSIPICYGMHLMEIMDKAGVDLKCAGSEEVKFNSVIDHHTLKRLGYKLGIGTWEHIGKGQAQTERREEQSFAEEPTEQPHPSSTTHPTPPRPRPTPNLSDQLTHLQQFLFEQLNLHQAQLHSRLDKMEEKLNSMDSRIQNLEAHLIPPPTPHATYDPSDPKGKRPMESSPVHIPSQSTTSSSSTSSQTAAQFELAAREPTSPTSKTPTPSSDTEATPSPPKQTSPIPSSFKEPSPPPSEPNPIPSPPHSPPPKEPSPPKSPPPKIPTPPPSPLPPPLSEPSSEIPQTIPPSIPESTSQPISEPTPSPLSISQAIIPHPSTTRPTYQRRKLAVTRPKNNTPLIPFPPPSPTSSN